MKKSFNHRWVLCATILALQILAVTIAPAQTAVWTNIYNGPGNFNDHPNAMAVDGNGNILVTGYSYGSGTGYDYATVKYSPAGVPLWINRYNGPGNNTDDPLAVAVDGSGNVFVVGYSYGGASTGFDFALIKYSSSGAPLWTNRFNGPMNGDDESYAVAVDTNGNVSVTGTANITSTGASGEDFTTIKYSNAGVQLWMNTYNGPGNGEDGGTAIAVDAGGNVFVTGSSTGTNGDYDFATIKYSNAGLPLWTNRYDGPGNGADQPYAIALDGSGNVFVTGYSTGSGSGKDYATLKYSSAGVPLWTNRYNGTGGGDDTGIRLAVDNSGNVFVTGYSTGNGTGYDYATIKYSVAGVPLWTNVYNGSANGDDYALAVAVNASGSVFVTGYSTSGVSGKDYATIKYSAAGLPLWTNFFNGTANGDDSGYAMAVDPGGNVIVTGYSTGNGSGWDFATIKLNDSIAPAPTVAISRTKTNTFLVSWPSTATGFNLQVSTNLAAANWGTPTETLNDNGTNKFIVVQPSTTNRFYRLKSP